ncbi:hypothetical protein [Paraglaciecola hydrolytica]|uniref:Porin n=1 Tax=Paraglaciecola hydrolytica TaxID=1799789 RepID=A0A136A2F8_9ALTE|nr:hypothetical protein [Paraglaciecola hydrolytica]KXI29416.1 hypothetical protein AX660_14900 [Paraglaciecola hydrolytica]
MKKVLALFAASFAFTSGLQAAEINVLVQANYVNADQQASWYAGDTGILAYSHSGANIQQAVLDVSDSFSSGLSYEVVANYYPLGEQNIGLSQALLSYKPLSQDTVRWRARAGLFYPAMSLENTAQGWLSPYSYTQSAINSWLGEELRIAGLEMTLFSPGRVRNSAFSWELHGGLFKGNDPMGAMLTWRGFAMHDRQSLYNEQIPMAAYPSVTGAYRLNHPAYVEPFHEFDGRLGFYVGAHLEYYKQSSVRYYYYDNQADPNQLNAQRIYGWRTRFHSLAMQHQFSANTRAVAQWMSGDTVMGKRYVAADFDAWYILLSHTLGPHRLSARFDKFEVTEDDVFPWDWNDSHGEALTLAWRYDFNAQWQFGLEQHFNRNYAASRLSLKQDPQIEQQQSMAVLQYRWSY